MKKLVTLTLIGAASALALSATAVSAPAVPAQEYNPEVYRDAPVSVYLNDGHRGDPNDWVSINQRQAQLDRRIDQGVRHGSLNRREAYRLRAEFNQIARLEARYRANGLNGWERADLDRRFDVLSARIRAERHDQYGSGYGYDNRR